MNRSKTDVNGGQSKCSPVPTSCRSCATEQHASLSGSLRQDNQNLNLRATWHPCVGHRPRDSFMTSRISKYSHRLHQSLTESCPKACKPQPSISWTSCSHSYVGSPASFKTMKLLSAEALRVLSVHFPYTPLPTSQQGAILSSFSSKDSSCNKSARGYLVPILLVKSNANSRQRAILFHIPRRIQFPSMRIQFPFK